VDPVPDPLLLRRSGSAGTSDMGEKGPFSGPQCLSAREGHAEEKRAYLHVMDLGSMKMRNSCLIQGRSACRLGPSRST
jgi:hypothetical protein